MIRYTYKGKNKQGAIVENAIRSKNKGEALAKLRRDGITITSIEIAKNQQDVLQQLEEVLHLDFNAPSLNDLIMFSRQMHSLTKAGVPIVRAIKTVADSAKNMKLEMALEDVVKKLEGGQSLATALYKHKDIFPTLMVALVNVGENTGNLDEVFKQISEHIGREADTRKKIKAAMRYPIMVLVAIFAAVTIINVFVIPVFAQFFAKFGADLPLPTRILIVSSNLTINYWHYCLAVLAGGIFFLRSFIKTPHGHYLWDRYKIKIPIIGSIVERALLARFARSFALTSRTGVPLLESINIIAKTTDNVYVSKKIMDMKVSIEHGEQLTASARGTGLFSQLVLQMMAIGEETGEVDKLLDEVADFYEEELDYDLKKLSESIEPILICVVAAMVLVLALGVFVPMWDISKVALKK